MSEVGIAGIADAASTLFAATHGCCKSFLINWLKLMIIKF